VGHGPRGQRPVVDLLSSAVGCVEPGPGVPAHVGYHGDQPGHLTHDAVQPLLGTYGLTLAKNVLYGAEVPGELSEKDVRGRI